jgi:formate dehydrogenase maturation protein FdhE
MEHTELNSGSAHDTDPGTFCPSCGANAYLAGAIRDIQTSETYRVFECGCGRVIWSRQRLQSVSDQVDQQRSKQ